MVGPLNWITPSQTIPGIVHQQVRTMSGFLPGDCPGASANVRFASLPYVHLPLTTLWTLIVVA